MNEFDKKLKEHGQYPLRAEKISVLLVQMGYKCDLRCSHCYVEASPDRTEVMSLETINKILTVLKKHDEIVAIDITGGAPELNPHFRHLVASATALGKKVIVRSNLTVFSEAGLHNIPYFLAENRVKIIASLPSVTEQETDRQRGKRTYQKVISALKMLNIIGYGINPNLEMDIAYNPANASMAPDRKTLEKTYKETLVESYGLLFNSLIAISNVPVGRLRKSMNEDEYKKYLNELEEKFNPNNIKDLMCRELLCVSYDGKLYDCGYHQIQGVPVKSPLAHIDYFDYDDLSKREIATASICFVCTAGVGIGCECGKVPAQFVKPGWFNV